MVHKHDHQGSKRIFNQKYTSFHFHYFRLIPPTKWAVKVSDSVMNTIVDTMLKLLNFHETAYFPRG